MRRTLQYADGLRLPDRTDRGSNPRQAIGWNGQPKREGHDMTEHRYWVCPDCDEERKVRVHSHSYPEAPYGATCLECGYQGDVSEFSLIAAESDALREEIGSLVSIEMYLQQQAVAFETFGDDNNLDPTTRGLLFTLSDECHDRHETVEERRDNMTELYEALTE